jgi:glycerophosphoryl diester phosphodiesterase
MRSSPSGPDPLDPGLSGFAHRGLHGAGIPENSLAAFEAAIKLGAGIECDVRLSGDRTAVVIHDSDLNRICNVALEVERTPAALLTGQRLEGSGQYIPALSELLDLVRGRVPLLIELKTHGGNAVSLCSEVVHDLAPMDGPVGVMSFDPQVGRWLRWNAAHIRRGLVVRYDLPRPKRWLAMFLATPQFIAVDRKALGQRWVRRARKRMPVYCWTIRTAAERAQAEVQADALIWEGDGRPRN